MTSSSHSMLDASRLRLLQAEEQRLSTALSAVRSSINELIPVAALPSEVLEQVFQICVSWLYGHQKHKNRLAFTQVCRKWRQISLGSTRLWRCIDLCDTRLAHEFLIRSKSAPISIISASPLKLSMRNLQSHADRLQSIDVFLFPDDMLDLFSSIGSHLPNLTHLSLKVPPVSTNFVLDIDIPLVSKLVLDCVAVPWNSCRSLTHLSLRGLTAEFSPSFDQLLSIFEFSPMLEYLRLDGISLPLPSSSALHAPITLAHLRDLILSVKDSVIAALLSRLSISQRTRIQLCISTIDDLRTLLPTNYDWHHANIGTLRLSRQCVRLLRPNSQPWSDESSESVLNISTTSSICTTFLSSMQPVLDLSRLTALELNPDVLNDLPRRHLQRLLSSTSNLESIRTAHNTFDGILNVLTGSGETLCPKLKHLSFVTHSTADIWWRFADEIVPSVYNLAVDRQARGHPLSSLEFKHCHGVRSEIVDRFRALKLQVKIVEYVASTCSGRRPLHG